MMCFGSENVHFLFTKGNKRLKFEIQSEQSCQAVLLNDEGRSKWHFRFPVSECPYHGEGRSLFWKAAETIGQVDAKLRIELCSHL